MTQLISALINKTMVGLLTKGGVIPRKIGIIMDGNRRYAEKNNIKKIVGHTDGMNTLLEMMKWAIDFGIQEVTVFAFSIDNFNRSKEEIDGLINIFKEFFYKRVNDCDFNSQGIKISIYGNWTFFENELQEIFREIEERTKNNNVIKLNICAGYNSTEEISKANEKMVKALHTNDDKVMDPLNLFESFLYGGYNLKHDLIIRTSGETRLSNFMLYQSRFSMIMFVSKYWPEFSFYDFFYILLRYNYNYSSHIKSLKDLEDKHSFPILN